LRTRNRQSRYAFLDDESTEFIIKHLISFSALLVGFPGASPFNAAAAGEAGVPFMTTIYNNFGLKEQTMAKKFTDLRSRMSPKARESAAAKAKAMLAEMPLHELRQARCLSQKMLAGVLHVQQPSIAKMEKPTDMYLSTLRSHIEAMGGELEVIARFPDGAVKISNFSQLDAQSTG
jgi:DNA-binding transcriptional regulator YiaG